MVTSRWVCLCAVVVVASIEPCDAGEAFSDFKDGVLIIPAESGELTEPMRAETEDGMEGGKYIFTSAGNKGLAAYRIRVPKTGKYYLFAHATGQDSTADSFFVEFDKAPSAKDTISVWDVDTRSKAYWQPVTGRKEGSEVRREWELSEGEHTLYVGGRENYTELDVLALAMTPDPQLKSLGPPLDLGKHKNMPGPDIEGRVPLIYFISYTDKYFIDPTYVDSFRNAPPDVVHIGKAAPITHNWGPVPMLFGENQATGGPGHTLNWDNIRLLSPDELRTKIKLITDTVKRLHDCGVGYVMPYIDERCLAGDPEKRQGFWNFYDHWDDYKEWLGPKPPEDPKDWLFRNAKGEIVSVYGPTPLVPYFAPLQRYGACPNNPHWRNFEKAIIRLIAKCGYDGVFIDNCGSGGDFCKYCSEKFRKFIGSMPPDELKRRYGVDDPTSVDLGEGVKGKLMDRFRRTMLRDYVIEMREAGREVNPKFVIFPNNPSLKHCFLLGEACALGMWENAFPSGIAIEGEPPETDVAGIAVADGAADEKPLPKPHSFLHADAFSELSVETVLPTRCAVNQPAKLAVKVLVVGNSNADDDAIDDVCIALKKEGTDDIERVMLAPKGMIGGAYPGVIHKPPVTLTGEWMPKQTGNYLVTLEYKYSDSAHEETKGALVRDMIRLHGCIYPNHIAEFSLAGCGEMRVIPHGSGQHPELAFAESAAFGRGASASEHTQWAVVRYQKFFREHPDFYDKAEPCGDIAILGAYWGENPGHALKMLWPSVGDRLSEKHVLFKSLIDEYIGEASLDGVATLILLCDDYDLSEAGREALKRFVARGGKVFTCQKGTTIRGVPLEDIVGPAAIHEWNWESPPEIGRPICPSRCRLRGLRFAAYTDQSRNRMLLHAVNYNIGPVDKARKNVVPVENVTVTLPLPDGVKVSAVMAYDPDRIDEKLPLEFSRDGKNVSFTIPKIKIYKVIEVRLVP